MYKLLTTTAQSHLTFYPLSAEILGSNFEVSKAFRFGKTEDIT